jgi:selenocysteine lyase/cysteine desulfurase
VTHEAIRLAAARTGASARRIPLYDRIDGISEEQIVGRIRAAIQPSTRVLGLTWVHSSTGLKLPIRAITDAVAAINAARDEADRVLVCVDGVHGFGNQDVTFEDLGCDFLIAGCHKWLFGPRGTGIVAGTRRGWEAVLPTIPSFIDDRAWNSWLSGEELDGPSTASSMTPGGFKAFEHQWALTEAFAFNEAIGKARIAERTRQLADQLKEALSGMSHVRLLTPRLEALSAGIVAFDIEGFSAAAAVRRLRERRIIASVSPYAVPHVRLTPSIVNTPEEVDAAAREIRALA